MYETVVLTAIFSPYLGLQKITCCSIMKKAQHLYIVKLSEMQFVLSCYCDTAGFSRQVAVKHWLIGLGTISAKG